MVPVVLGLQDWISIADCLRSCAANAVLCGVCQQPNKDDGCSTEEVLRFSKEVRADVDARLDKLERQAEERWSQYGHVISEVVNSHSNKEVITPAQDQVFTLSALCRLLTMSNAYFVVDKEEAICNTAE
eukprot:1704954-Amphidinium_carterae.1